MAKGAPSGRGSGAAGDDDGRRAARRPAADRSESAEASQPAEANQPGEVSRPDADPQRTAGPETPRALRGAAAVTLVEAVALGGGGIYWLVRTLFDRPESFSGSLAGAAFALLAALLLVRLALGVARIEGWSRSPLVVFQILFLPVGYTLAFPSGLPAAGVPVLALCATVLYLVFTPEGRSAFQHR